jgi:hypothetical protein
MDEAEGEYYIKLPLNGLKLAMCYAAGRLNIKSEVGYKWIEKETEDVERAIEDIGQFHKNWKFAMSQWTKYGHSRLDDRIKTSKYDVGDFTLKAIENGGLISAPEIRALGSYSNYNKVIDILQLAVGKGYLEKQNEIGQKGTLSDKEFEYYHKKSHSSVPVIYRVTEEGLKKYGVGLGA